jgi:hypothetical protein
LNHKNYYVELTRLLTTGFPPAGFHVTNDIELDPVPENANYAALTFGLNGHRIVFRKGKVTPDRPGAFLAIWQRPSPELVSINTSDIALSDIKNNKKPIPLNAEQLDYLFIEVHSYPESGVLAEGSDLAEGSVLAEGSGPEMINKLERGMFIFPVSLLIKKGIICGDKSKGKNGFRVFPPWSQDRGKVGTQVFSDSGKKTQRWQLPYFVSIDENGLIDPVKLKTLINL